MLTIKSGKVKIDKTRREFSKKNIGVYGPKWSLLVSFNNGPINTPSYGDAKNFCAREILKRGNTVYTIECINIHSDSQAALKLLESFTFESRTAWDCFNVVNDMVGVNRVSSHTGIDGNKVDNRFARADTQTLLWKVQRLYKRCG